MSAYRDRSQGVAYLYKNLFELYMKSKLQNNGQGIVPDPVDVMVFRPREKGESMASPIRKAQINSSKNSEKGSDTNSIEEKLRELQNVHSRLKTMMNEINELVEKKKKDS